MVSSRPDRPSYAGLVAGVVGLLFLYASVAKAIHSRAFLGVVLFLLPEGAREEWLGRLGVGMVVGVEAALAGLLLCGLQARAVLGLSIGVIATFTVALVFLTGSEAPACGCLGASIKGVRHEAVFGIVRNLGLLGVLTWLWKVGGR